ncbi:MAG: thiamine phosphate synthase [Pseudomonadota bacterium]
MAWAADWRVYLHLPAAHAPSNLDELLGDALATGAVGAVEIPLGGLTGQQMVETVERFRPIVQPAGVPLILQGTTNRQILGQVDGLRLDDSAELPGARRALPANGLIGVTVGDSRDAAMQAGEQKPDFLYLPKDPDFVAWWAELMVIPCVAPTGDLLADAADIAALGPDFVALDAIAWNHPDGPAGAIRALAGMAAA